MIESIFINKLQLQELKLSLSKYIKLCETVIIREFGLKLSTSAEIFNTMDTENQTINKALNCIKKDLIPIRNMLAHVSDDEHWNIAVSEFEHHCNQGLIGYQMLLEHVKRNSDYHAGLFHLHVKKSLDLNQKILEYCK